MRKLSKTIPKKIYLCFFFVCARLAVVYITADGDVIVKRVTTAYRYRKNTRKNIKSKRFFCVLLHPEIVAVVLMFFLWRPYLYNFLSDLSYLCVCVCWLYYLLLGLLYFWKWSQARDIILPSAVFDFNGHLFVDEWLGDHQDMLSYTIQYKKRRHFIILSGVWEIYISYFSL
jgi:hypothetical protein